MSFDQRHVHQMLAQEPRLKFVRPQHVADNKIIGTVIAQFRCAPGQRARLTNNDLVRIQQP